MTRISALLVTLALAVTAPAAAQSRSHVTTRPGAGSVLDLISTERASALRIRAEARARLLDALDGDRDISLGPAPDVLLEQAIARYTEVLRVFPDDYDATLERAFAYAHFERTLADGREERRDDEALADLEQARALGPDRDAALIAFELAVLRTRRADYAGADAEYQRAFASTGLLPAPIPEDVTHREALLIAIFVDPLVRTASMLSNWAEVTMLAGDPTTAIERYRAAIDASEGGTDGRTLALWGLALAQERSGSHDEALATALGAMDADPSADLPRRVDVTRRYGAFAALHLDGVFFEPACEIHAYESLGHEALAMHATTAERRIAEWTAARLSARFFLAEGGRTSIYAHVAEEAEQRLTAAIASASPR